MITQVLRDCRKYEEEKEQFITEKERPAFHLSSRAASTCPPAQAG